MVVAVVGAEEALGVVTDTMDLVMVSVLFTSFSPTIRTSCKSCLHLGNEVCFGDNVIIAIMKMKWLQCRYVKS